MYLVLIYRLELTQVLIILIYLGDLSQPLERIRLQLSPITDR